MASNTLFWRSICGGSRRGRRSGAAAREALLAKIFPAGMEKLASVPAEGSAAPTGGLQIVGSSRVATKAGLAPGDVVVAVDGVAIQTRPQYMTVRLVRREPEMPLIVWRKDHYLTAITRHFERWLDVEVKPYKGPPTNERKYI